MTAYTGLTVENAPLAPFRILIVDDNELTARSLAKVLDNANYRPAIALSGSEAVHYSRTHKFDAALVDVHLPDMNGLVLTQRLREVFGPEAPIVILSGDTSMDVINALPHVGATYFFSKPVNVGYLLGQLKEWLGEAKTPKSQSESV